MQDVINDVDKWIVMLFPTRLLEEKPREGQRAQINATAFHLICLSISLSMRSNLKKGQDLIEGFSSPSFPASAIYFPVHY